jgi:hypothetical protein
MVGRATSEMRRTEFVTSGPQYSRGHICQLHVRVALQRFSRKIQWEDLCESYKNIISKTSQANWCKGRL